MTVDKIIMCFVNTGNWMSGVQFGLKSYEWFQFEITSMISDQNCTTRSSIATLLDPFWNRTIFYGFRWYATLKTRKRFQNFRQSCVLLTDRIENVFGDIL